MDPGLDCDRAALVLQGSLFHATEEAMVVTQGPVHDLLDLSWLVTKILTTTYCDGGLFGVATITSSDRGRYIGSLKAMGIATSSDVGRYIGSSKAMHVAMHFDIGIMTFG